jgi:hypothetical protein
MVAKVVVMVGVTLSVSRLALREGQSSDAREITVSQTIRCNIGSKVPSVHKRVCVCACVSGWVQPAPPSQTISCLLDGFEAEYANAGTHLHAWGRGGNGGIRGILGGLGGFGGRGGSRGGATQTATAPAAREKSTSLRMSDIVFR